MRKSIWLLIFLLTTSLSSFGILIKGKVVTTDGRPLKGAYVYWHSKRVVTNEKGYFSIEIGKAKKIRLTITHEEYMGKEVILSSKDYSKEITITLFPYIRQTEEVVVTAMRYPEPISEVPAAENIVTEEVINEKMSSNIAEVISDIPGVSAIGVGGFNKVPAIRGLARRRVLILVDNARIWSNRRTGPDASFINPKDVEKIEVLRSPSSVFYGSDAIGGVIHILTKESISEPLEGNVHFSFNTNNNEKKAGMSISGIYKNTGVYFSIQGRESDNYHSPSQEVLMSDFSIANLTFKLIYNSKKRNINLSYLGSRGKNIGKPLINSLKKPTWYPRESQNLFIFHWDEKSFLWEGDLSLSFYLNPNERETKKEKLSTFKEKESFAVSKSKDYGFQLSYNKNIKQGLRLTTGLDVFGRAEVETKNEDKYYDSGGNVIESRVLDSIKDGWRNDIGFFISADYSGIKNLDLAGGVRIDFLKTKATSQLLESISGRDRTWTGFIGASWKFSSGLILFGNLSRAYRFPSLNELYYTGITGRGYIIGNPNLKPEQSINIDLGLKLVRKKLYMGLYFFNYIIDKMIERYINSEGIYTYNNLEKGKIRGVEYEMEYFPKSGIKIFGNFYHYLGKSETTGDWLNDIPSDRIFLGTRFWKGKLWMELNGIYQKKKDNPGPAEIYIPGFSLFNIKAGYYVSPSIQFYLNVSNILNKEYRARPDPDSPFEPGRSFIFGANLNF